MLSPKTSIDISQELFHQHGENPDFEKFISLLQELEPFTTFEQIIFDAILKKQSVDFSNIFSKIIIFRFHQKNILADVIDADVDEDWMILYITFISNSATTIDLYDYLQNEFTDKSIPIERRLRLIFFFLENLKDKFQWPHLTANRKEV